MGNGVGDGVGGWVMGLVTWGWAGKWLTPPWKTP